MANQNPNMLDTTCSKQQQYSCITSYSVLSVVLDCFAFISIDPGSTMLLSPVQEKTKEGNKS
eukprot:1158553-Pelagomonas_calceolata.AAC.7